MVAKVICSECKPNQFTDYLIGAFFFGTFYYVNAKSILSRGREQFSADKDGITYFTVAKVNWLLQKKSEMKCVFWSWKEIEDLRLEPCSLQDYKVIYIYLKDIN